MGGLQRCAMTAILHLNTALNIKDISTLYKDANSVTHCSTRLKGDNKFNLALDNRLERESNYTQKKTITVEAEAIYNRALNYIMIQGEIPGTTPENES